MSHAGWWSGAQLYGRVLKKKKKKNGRLDAWHGAHSWAEALTWIAQHQPSPRPRGGQGAELHLSPSFYLGHGSSGAA